MKGLVYFLKKQGTTPLAYLAMILAVAMIIISQISNKKVDDNSGQITASYQLIQQTDKLLAGVKDMQIGQRGYLLFGLDPYLVPYATGKKDIAESLSKLRELTADSPEQQKHLQEVDKNLSRAYAFIDKTVDAVKAYGPDSAQVIILANDEGKVILETLWANVGAMTQAEKERLHTSNEQFVYTKTVTQLVQIVIIVLIVLVLFILAVNLNKARKNRSRIFEELDLRNSELILNEGGDEKQEKDEKYVVDRLINNLKHSIEFIQKIGKGQYDAELTGLTLENTIFNQHNLAGSLMQMREQLKQVALEDQRRNWTTSGLAAFADILRGNHSDLKELSLTIIQNLVKYLRANQGALFVLNQEEGEKPYLEMLACYAYDRRKYLNKRILPGEGLVGQCVLEADTIYLTEIPQGYTKITSGLGDSTPNCLLIVPLKMNNQIYGVVEIASFQAFEKYQIEYVEKVAESIASTLSMVKVNENTQKLLERAQEQTEAMRSQEEEMRQNMEELQATQEEMHRKEREYLQQIEDLQVRLHVVK